MEKKKMEVDAALEGFSPISTTRISWNSRKRSASGRNLDKARQEGTANVTPTKQDEPTLDQDNTPDSTTTSEHSERRKALFDPLEPIKNINGRRPSTESLLPPPSFDAACYPKGSLIGKKRKLVNVDVVESMRRIAVQEMNRKDREIDGLNKQLEEDSSCVEYLQLQLLQEKSKRWEVERKDAMLQEHISMLMNMLQESPDVDET
ncbi:licodione synthase-like [Hibiscus syriacus]|uniref:Licodione synthase-like n=1 Tax=Hibiscus syriacus TaxID=106335 RepID=A0A6A3D6T3_HIBSY|nr:protein HEADING DATE REPRESSOR 1-like [Hibiscus syriacus]KAE8735648.1 licodione synthase-like [Hibiscus syriacus]